MNSQSYIHCGSGAQICCRNCSKPAKSLYVAIASPPNKNKNNIYYIRRYLTALALQPRCKNVQDIHDLAHFNGLVVC